MREREIRIFDLLVEALLSWRSIIVWMLLGGILMGGFSYVRSYHAVERQKEQMADSEQNIGESLQGDSDEITSEYLREQLTEQQINTIRNAIAHEENSAERQAYMQESVWIAMDPLNAPRARLTFLIKADEKEKAYSIERIYEDIVNSELSCMIADNSDGELSEAAASELIALSRSSDAFMEGGDSFCITIYHNSKDGCEELALFVEKYLAEKQKMLVKDLGEHDLVLVNKSISSVMVPSLIDARRNMESDILAWDTAAAKLKAAFSESEWMYYNWLTTGKADGIPDEYLSEDEREAKKMETDNVAAVASPSISIKYVILGMMLFACAYVGYVLVKCIMNSKLHLNDDVKKMFNVPQLGQIPDVNNKKKIFDFVDRWILQLCNHNKRIFAVEEAIGLAAVAVKITAKKEELDTVYCIGCDLKEAVMDVAEQIQSTLKEEKISMQILNNVLYNQESMEQLEQAKCVFLLEKAGETLYTEIAQELELLQRQGIKVLGIVVVG